MSKHTTEAAGRDEIWRSPEIGRRFLEGIRGGIPLAAEQLDVVSALLRGLCPEPRSFLDIGCGDGTLGMVILASFPTAEGTFLDFSSYMLEKAREKVPASSAARFVLSDYGKKGWTAGLERDGFDVIVSGFSIHHQPDERKRELYEEVFELLTPGGLFLNLEHVSSPSARIEEIYNEYFVDSLHRFHESTIGPKSREEVRREYLARQDGPANILAPLETQCAWLREIGFIDVDGYFKVLELALFGGTKPFSNATRIPPRRSPC